MYSYLHDRIIESVKLSAHVSLPCSESVCDHFKRWKGEEAKDKSCFFGIHLCFEGKSVSYHYGWNCTLCCFNLNFHQPFSIFRRTRSHSRRLNNMKLKLHTFHIKMDIVSADSSLLAQTTGASWSLGASGCCASPPGTSSLLKRQYGGVWRASMMRTPSGDKDAKTVRGSTSIGILKEQGESRRGDLDTGADFPEELQQEEEHQPSTEDKRVSSGIQHLECSRPFNTHLFL